MKLRTIMLSVIITLGATAQTAVIQPAPKPLKTEKLSNVEKLAAEGLGSRQQQLSTDMQEYAKSVCEAHKLPVEECQIDPAKGEVYHMEKQAPPKPPETKK